MQAITRRLDVVTAVARLLLENEGFSESRTLQRCARLIARELNAWVLVDMERRHRVRRQFAIGPDDPGLAELTSALAAVDPPTGSVPCAVFESGHPILIAHAEDSGALGASVDGEPLLAKLDATSVLSVPLTDGEQAYGVLTLVRRAGDGHFKVADLALVSELGEQMALAIRVSRLFRHRSDTAEALHASLVPRRRPEIPGVQMAAMYLAATAEDPEVGGDFYDVYQTPDGWGLAVGDVCGMGEDAAAAMAAARHAIRVLARRCADPGEVLAGANEIVLADELAFDGGFVTASIAHLNWQGDQLRVVLGSAGHPPAAVLRSDGRVRMMGGGGLPLGLFADAGARHAGTDPGARGRAVPVHRRGGPGARPGQHLLRRPAGRRTGRPGRPAARPAGGVDAPGHGRVHRGQPGGRRHDAGDPRQPGRKPGEQVSGTVVDRRRAARGLSAATPSRHHVRVIGEPEVVPVAGPGLTTRI